MAKVSVIIPVYNTEKYIKKCIQSVVDQTLDDIEIILIDDGSTDSSLTIMKEFEQKYPDKIKLLTKENGGQGTARNLGMNYVTGEYIGFMDSDDWADVHMYEEMYNRAIEDDLDYVECMYYFQKENGVQLPPYTASFKFANNKEMFIGTMAAPWNKIIKTEVLRDNDVTFTEGCIYEDTAFHLKMIPFIDRTDLIEKKFVYHIDRGTSTMNINKSKKVGNIFPVLADAIDFYKSKGVWEEYKKEMEYFCVRVLFCSSFMRIAAVPDKELRKQFLNETWKMIEEEFPDFKKNPYLDKDARGKYIKKMNRFTSKVFLGLFHIKESIKAK